MQDDAKRLSRRTLAKLTGAAAAAYAVGAGQAAGRPHKAESLFNGKTLEGWIQVENSATSLSSSGITGPEAFVSKLTSGKDPVSVYLRGQLQDSVKADLANYAPSNENAKAVISALIKNLNQVLAGPSLHGRANFGGIAVSPETDQLLQQDPRGYSLARLNKLLLEDAYRGELARSASTGWVAKDGAMASTGAGRGVIYTAKDYGRFRLMFTMRHVSGNPDHQACVLIFCTRPRLDEVPLDALAGIQFQVPLVGRWDYRPGHNNNGGELFTLVQRPPFNNHEWSRAEIVADATTGTARMAVAQPPGSKAVEVLRFKDPSAGKVGPIAWQMHNPGLFDEFKDVTIEVDTEDDGLVTTR